MTVKLQAILNMANESFEKGLPFKPDDITGEVLRHHIALLKQEGNNRTMDIRIKFAN